MNRLRSLVSSNTVSLYSYVPHTASIATRRHAARKRCALINRCLGAWPADSFCRPDHQGIRCRQSGWLGGAGHAVEGESLHARPRSRRWRCDGVCVCRLELAAEKQRGLAGAAFGCPTRRCVWLALGLTNGHWPRRNGGTDSRWGPSQKRRERRGVDFGQESDHVRQVADQSSARSLAQSAQGWPKSAAKAGIVKASAPRTHPHPPCGCFVTRCQRALASHQQVAPPCRCSARVCAERVHAQAGRSRRPVCSCAAAHRA